MKVVPDLKRPVFSQGYIGWMNGLSNRAIRCVGSF